MRPRVRKVSGLDVWGTLSERFWCLEGLRGVPDHLSGGLGDPRGVLDGSNIYFWKTRPELDPWRAFWASRASFQKCPLSLFWEVNLFTVSSETAFSKLSDFEAMRCGHCVMQLFCRFPKLAFCETVRWICYKNQMFFNNSDIGIFGFQWKNDAENVISGGEIWSPGRSILR